MARVGMGKKDLVFAGGIPSLSELLAAGEGPETCVVPGERLHSSTYGSPCEPGNKFSSAFSFVKEIEITL